MRYRPIRKNYPIGKYGDIDYYEKLERYCTYLENKNKALTEQCNIANVSNCAFGKILDEFRQWQKEWDLYDSRQTLREPQSSDDFIKELKSKYVVGFKRCL